MSDDRAGRPWRFPELPIVNGNANASANGPLPAAPSVAPVSRRSAAQKYGGLFWLGIGGLIVVVTMVGWFGWGLWRNRDIWSDVYILSDRKRSDVDRIHAAFRLSANPRLSDEQRRDLCFRRELPELARYVLAESISTELEAWSPRAYAFMVARSPDWPDWLRLLLARRLAYGAGRGHAVPAEALEELSAHSDPMVRAWALYALAVRPDGGPEATTATEKLRRAADADGPSGELAADLLETLPLPDDRRERRLDEIALWMRHHHPQARRIWAEGGKQSAEK